ncbi:MAG: hypothetical protein GF416_08055 [Candidatus Altiarchaeales archaeon]|nr:hypothetical protein [Candidatus Altiarchaeales archaeon]MBD3417067.1 hypothetical protein [Candidatus Altiarchaeales archaeon]
MDQSGVSIVTLILLAGIVSVEAGFSTAILEIVSGVIASNYFGLKEVFWIDFLANFGLLGVMFFAGFETEVRVLQKYYKKSLKIALPSFAVPFILTYAVTTTVLGLDQTAAILMSIGMSTTSLALVFPYLREEGLLKMEIGQILFASAMFVDLMSMFSLSFFFTGLSIGTLLFIVFIVGALYILPHVGQWFFKRYCENMVEVELRFIMLTLVGLSFLSESVGIHSAVLAYLIGISMSSLLENHEELENKLRGIVYGFMGPIFFFQSGYLMDLTHFNLETLKVTGILTIVAFGSKYISTRVSVKRVLGRGSRLSALFFNYRLTFGIIVVLLGFRQGIIDEVLYTAALSTILISSIISSISLKITPTETLYKIKGRRCKPKKKKGKKYRLG